MVPGRDAPEGGTDHRRRLTKEVAFEPIDGPINDRIDDAYRAKYRNSRYLSPMIGPRARSASVRVMPRDVKA